MRYQALAGKSSSFAPRAALATLVAALPAAPAIAGGTPAGTSISNVATATYELPSGDEQSVESNEVTLLVDELLDVAVASDEPGDVVSAPGLSQRLQRFTVTNAGNGREAFSLEAVTNEAGDDFDPTAAAIFLDANGNGAFDAGVDRVYAGGANDPELAPDESLSIFVLATMPGSAKDGQRAKVRLNAIAKTGTGAPGTAFAGAGEGGGNAVVGATGADADGEGWYRIAAADIAFVKSATVVDPYGGTTQGPGAIITYTLTATVNGSGSLANVRVADPIPDGTSYQAGSITLDTAALTDAADADTARFTGSGIEVGLGTLAAGDTRTISFKVKID